MTITHRTQSQTTTKRDAWVEINLAALERNYRKITDLIKTDIMAIVKADAYGHGALTICPILQSLGVKSFGVATVDEGVSLRQAGIKLPILILGATPFWAYETCIKNNLSITIYSEEQINQLQETATKHFSTISVQLKIDTGMNRLGVSYLEASQVIDKIMKSKGLSLDGIFSHLSDAKNLDFSKIQKERFEYVLETYHGMSLQKHIANSFAAINYPDFRYNLSRIGIALFGQEFNFLESIISLKGRITEIHKVQKGEYVSYERSWQANKDTLVATVPIGYADGIDWKLSNKIEGFYKGKKIKQIGNITMDQIMFDISEVNDPKINEVIALLDKDLPISNWAKTLGTITYELVCRLKLRLPRIYTRN